MDDISRRLYDDQKEFDAFKFQRSQRGEENAGDLAKFYYSLALFSGGTVALSITFLGYLKTLDRPLHDLPVLKFSWIALIVSVVTSFGWVLANLRYRFYALEVEWGERKRKNVQYKLDVAENSLDSPGDLETNRLVFSTLINHASAYTKKHLRKRSLSKAIWILCGSVAPIAFVVGLCTLVRFAFENASLSALSTSFR